MRIGVAFAFLYPPYSALMDPASWLGYFPHFMRGIVPDALLLHGFGVLGVVLALWILSGKKIFWPSAAATAMMNTANACPARASRRRSTGTAPAASTRPAGGVNRENPTAASTQQIG